MQMNFCPNDGETPDRLINDPESGGWAYRTRCPKCKRAYEYIYTDRMSGVYFDNIRVFDEGFKFPDEIDAIK